MNAISQYRRYRALLGSQWLDPSAIAVLQDSKLRALIEHAYRHVPYYRGLFDAAGLDPGEIRGTGDLGKVPVTTKAMLRAVPPRKRVSAAYDIDSLTTERTSGSTGEPFTSYFDRRFTLTRNGLYLRALHVAGYRPGQKLMLITAGDKPHRNWLRWKYTSIEEPAEKLVSIVNKFRPDVVYGCATPLRLMAEYVKTSRLRCHKPRTIVSTAEALDGAGRRLLEAVFAADIYDIYGLTEMGVVAWECPAQTGYHVSADTTIVEVDRRGDADSGKLIMTNLELEAMPLIRFETGDIATRLDDDECTCGRTLPRLDRIEGRVVDCLQLPDGRLVTPYRVTLALENIAGVGRYQVRQTAMDHCIVRIQAGDAASDGLQERIRHALAPVVGSGVRIDVKFEGSLSPPPGRKFRIVESISSSNPA